MPRGKDIENVPANDNLDDGMEIVGSRPPRRRFLRAAIAGCGVLAVTAAGLAILDHPSGGITQTATVKKSKTEADFVRWENMAAILAAEGTFSDEAQAEVHVRMAVDPPGSNIPLLGGAVKFAGDKAAPDYDLDIATDCVGKMQEIIPVMAISQSHTADGGLLETINMKYVKMNPYCVNTIAEVDPSTAQVFYDGYTIARDTITKIGKKLHLLDDNSLPKPDVMLNNITDNTKNKLSTEALKAMMGSCSAQLNSQVNKSAIQGVQKTILGLDPNITAKNLHIKTIGQPTWKMPTDPTINKLTPKYMEFTPKLKLFKSDKASCKTNTMQVIGGDAKGTK